jgi:hypothetical protein
VLQSCGDRVRLFSGGRTVSRAIMLTIVEWEVAQEVLLVRRHYGVGLEVRENRILAQVEEDSKEVCSKP